MNFTEANLTRIESIRNSIDSKDMKKLIPYLKQLDNNTKEIILLPFNSKGNPFIRNNSVYYKENEINENEMKVIIYLGTNENTHYICCLIENQPINSIEMNLRECMFKLEKEMCNRIGYASSLIKFYLNNQFCPKCGNKVIYCDYGTHLLCEQCKNEIFPRTDPCIIVLIKHPSEMKCLFVRKSIMPEHRYTCVAGFLEVGESAEECVKRECFEEVHLRVKDIKYIASSYYPMPITNQIMLGFECQSIDTEIDIIPGNELCEAFWVDINEVKIALEESSKQNPTGNYTVPPQYIAHQLFKHWVNEN